MIGLDTNVLVRYIMQDDAKQSPLATRLIESLTVETPGFVPLVVVVELGWALSGAYGLGRSEVCSAFEGLLRTKVILVEGAATVWKALRALRSGAADFAYCLIERSAAAAGCERTMTFDRVAAKPGGMTLVA